MISSGTLYSIGMALWNMPVVQSGIATAVAAGVAAVKALIAPLISFVLANLGIILVGITIAVLLGLVASWLIDKYNEEKYFA